MENLRDFLLKSLNLPKCESATSDASRHKFFSVITEFTVCVCVFCVFFLGGGVRGGQEHYGIFPLLLPFICIEKGLVWGQKGDSENFTLRAKIGRITRPTSL